MGSTEKIIFSIGFLLLITVLIFPPVKMEGYSPIFAAAHRINETNSILIPGGDYGESDSRNINWTKDSRRFFFQDNNFETDIILKIVPENLSENNPAESIDGTIEWESEINIGRMLIELLLISLVSVASIFYLRQK